MFFEEPAPPWSKEAIRGLSVHLRGAGYRVVDVDGTFRDRDLPRTLRRQMSFWHARVGLWLRRDGDRLQVAFAYADDPQMHMRAIQVTDPWDYTELEALGVTVRGLLLAVPGHSHVPDPTVAEAQAPTPAQPELAARTADDPGVSAAALPDAAPRSRMGVTLQPGYVGDAVAAKLPWFDGAALGVSASSRRWELGVEGSYAPPALVSGTHASASLSRWSFAATLARWFTPSERWSWGLALRTTPHLWIRTVDSGSQAPRARHLTLSAALGPMLDVTVAGPVGLRLGAWVIGAPLRLKLVADGPQRETLLKERWVRGGATASLRVRL